MGAYGKTRARAARSRRWLKNRSDRHRLRQTRSVCAWERSHEAIHSFFLSLHGLLRFVGNDKWSHLPRIAECERRHPPRGLVEDQRARDRRLGALAAVFALAEPAVDADRRAFGIFEIHAGGIDQPGGMTDFATQPDRETWLRLRMRRHRPAQHLRNTEISRAVGQFDHLPEQTAPRIEGRMHVPQRTGTAEFGERKSARGETLGDVAGIVDAQQKE